jgi:hypothetical protein
VLEFTFFFLVCEFLLLSNSARYTYWPPEITEDDINNDIETAISLRVGKSADYDFIWYENPKMTIPGIYHVQVFWCVHAK